ncbi:hypothetical protein C8F04DRAFT_1093726 [Mycena alexandri]|uniref:BTB domain-containing protein n=1 Tax=Mycena alexandri TaxID=1745969 RepID=A0AAD6T1T8_9AGAR|nr:hypothetical protein C8F04DRAFT_1093726 [Mycena alexandri]
MIVVSDDEDTGTGRARTTSTSRKTRSSKASPSKPKPIDASKIIVVRPTRAVTRSAARDSLQSTVEPAPSFKRELDDTATLLSAPTSKRAKIASSELDISVSSPSKRANISASSQHTSRLFVKHARFWALDGNAILQFGSVALRVHQSRLSTQSVWFDKLFDQRAGCEPLLEADEESINDVVVEELGGFDVFRLDLIGSVDDFEALLTAMEDAIAFHYALPTFPTAAAIFRAATTFKFNKFVEFTRKYFLETFSEDLDKVDATLIPYAAAAVTLGRKWNIPGILKRAFYELLRAPPATTTANDEEAPGVPAVGDRLKGLEPADLTLLADAQKHLTAAWMTVFLRPDGTVCPAKTPCSATKRNGGWTAIAGKGKILQKFLLDPICGLDALTEVKWDEAHGFCGKCAAARNASFLKRKAQIWEDMDVWFRIPVEKGAEEKGNDSA